MRIINLLIFFANLDDYFLTGVGIVSCRGPRLAITLQDHIRVQRAGGACSSSNQIIHQAFTKTWGCHDDQPYSLADVAKSHRTY